MLMQNMPTTVVEREIHRGGRECTGEKAVFWGGGSTTLALLSPGLPKPKSCSCGYPMDLRGDLLSEGETEMLVEGVRFWTCSRCGDSVKEHYCFPTYQETM